MIVDDFRPILFTFIVFLFVCLFVSIFYKGKHKFIIGVAMSMMSLICTITSAKTMWDIGITADENNMVGDPVSFNLFLLVFGLSILILNYPFILKKDLPK
ncbi:hypothetical protein [Niallia sp. Krafla_26]|uniref:hypothetical protein n=1 Tax=Niallia sp. Krafla_26 TaxID=3064703 RepID=UPI003D17A987